MSMSTSSSAKGVQEIKDSLLTETNQLDASNLSIEQKIDIIDALVDTLTNNLGLTKTDVETIKADTALLKTDIGNLENVNVPLPKISTLKKPNSGMHVFTDIYTYISPRNDGFYYYVTDTVIILYDADGAVVFTLAPTDINASATKIMSNIYWDTTDDKIYALGWALGWIYFASINTLTGAVTPIATIATTGTPSTNFRVNGFYRSNTTQNFVANINSREIEFDVNGTITVPEVISFSYSHKTKQGFHLEYISVDGMFIRPSSGATGYFAPFPKDFMKTNNLGAFHITSNNLVQVMSAGSISRTYDREDFERWIDAYLIKIIGATV